MNDNVITTDHPLTPAQQKTLAALLDAVLPESDDGKMPSAGTLDLVAYLRKKSAEFIPVLVGIVEQLDASFGELPYTERHAHALAFSEAQPELFAGLLFQVYDCYYQDERVMVGIGMEPGPPFPRGNSIEEGDLSLLDPVVQNSRTYRK
ncbi:MAG: hypothetical protein QF921_09555 [Pseudomonadales bacterium]|jgi:hypothetical protein|nr:hypothetical protein [Pseudomonadales bacterium]MDP6472830.1 hypothetical protein [Pseudomonadales bacterium]MDP6828046.1 hypothetical protein [Pseudomonadales bacterium]MDP6971739.1 hypothetical protein [Pseudomonadales bacterium]|tara:strand:- start:662 stop:1108 length:447 start_codon:yes stop_codon:yes gene_type:complete